VAFWKWRQAEQEAYALAAAPLVVRKVQATVGTAQHTCARQSVNANGGPRYAARCVCARAWAAMLLLDWAAKPHSTLHLHSTRPYIPRYSYLPTHSTFQGDLTDPLYFDYIACAQYAVIGREMLRGEQVFSVRPPPVQPAPMLEFLKLPAVPRACFLINSDTFFTHDAAHSLQ
jgi:hypothetical protein